MSILDQFETPFEAYQWSSKMGAERKTRPLRTADGEHWITFNVKNEHGFMVGTEMLIIGGVK